ncbi:MAG TPA: HD domain-containing protein [Patescibacteria group bacterium]|nr:HD domain-containing protein [Patescibacteria group bacterium]
MQRKKREATLFSTQNPELLKAVKKIAETINRLPKNPAYKQKPRALLVGGFVRDALLEIESKDADLEIYGVEPTELEQLLRTLFPGRVIEAGRAFGVLKIPIKEGMDIDIAIPRRETKQGNGHKGFLIESDPNLSHLEAARRRDFTINAIACDPLTEEMLDPYLGKADLQRKILRVVDPKTFIEDPLRVYRAIQFAARFTFAIEETSFALMKSMVEKGDLDQLSKERISDEIKKLLLKAERPSIGFELASELGVIARDYPMLANLQTTPQEPEWHPEGNVWIHTMMVVDAAANIIRRKDRQFTDLEKLEVIIGALCHDLGKPATTQMGEKHGIPRIRSLGHEEAGIEPAKALLEKWMFGDIVLHAATMAASQHLKPSAFSIQLAQGIITRDQYANAVRKLLKKIYPLSWRVLLAVAEADSRGRDLPEVATRPYEEGELFSQVVHEHQLDQEPVKPLVQGRDLLARGLKPGPKIGELVKKIEEARDQGIIRTREQALALLDEMLKK